jgi:hypothetical protein
MTYTESNHSFVSSILRNYFREAGMDVPEDLLGKIAAKISDEDNAKKNFSAATEGDFITQKALSLLHQMQNDN